MARWTDFLAARGLRGLVLAVLLACAGIVGPAAAQSACPAGWSVVAGTEDSGMIQCQRTAPDGTVETAWSTDFESGGLGAYSPDEDGASAAVRLFYFSMGRNPDGTQAAESFCITCDFIAHFITALATFSASMFGFFQGFFVVLAPIFLGTWIGIEAIRLLGRGGEGGRDFVWGLVKKSSLFFVLWGLLFDGFGVMGPHLPGSGQTGATYFAGPAWHAAGPEVLRLSFDLNADVRSQTAAGLMAVAGRSMDSAPFLCAGLETRVKGLVNNDALHPAVHSITQTACVVERAHSLGLAAGVGMVLSVWYQVPGSADGLAAGMLLSIAGLALIVMFLLSGGWLVFLLLDVAVKALVMAGILPLLALAALFKPSRPMALAGLKNLISVPVVALALGLTSLAGFFLILNVVNVYEETRGVVQIALNAPLAPLEATDTVGRFAELLERAQLPFSDLNAIPFGLQTPWMIYLVLVAFGMFSFGRKVVSTIEEVMGVQSTSEMADGARSLMIKGAMVGVGVAASGAALVGGAAMSGAGSAAGAKGAGAASGSGMKAVRALGARQSKARSATISPFGNGNPNEEEGR